MMEAYTISELPEYLGNSQQITYQGIEILKPAGTSLPAGIW